MPPKPKITKDMVIAAAFEVVRKAGAKYQCKDSLRDTELFHTARHVPFCND